MKIQCANCAIEHALDPPAWVLSSGRPFRFRCASCGHSQMVDVSDAPAPAPASTQAPDTPLTGPPGATIAPEEEPAAAGGTVYLKQDGTVYLVRDWATLQRWIMERRIGREDLVSEGGVRWEPIGGRPELSSFFAAVEKLEAAEVEAGVAPATPTEAAVGEAAVGEAAPEALGGETPFHTGPPLSDSLDDDEPGGIPTGLPPLPTEEVSAADEGEGEGDEDYPDAPPSRGTWSPPEEEEGAAVVLDEEEDLGDTFSFPDNLREPSEEEEPEEELDLPASEPEAADLSEFDDLPMPLEPEAADLSEFDDLPMPLEPAEPGGALPDLSEFDDLPMPLEPAAADFADLPEPLSADGPGTPDFPDDLPMPLEPDLSEFGDLPMPLEPDLSEFGDLPMPLEPETASPDFSEFGDLPDPLDSGFSDDDGLREPSLDEPSPPAMLETPAPPPRFGEEVATLSPEQPFLDDTDDELGTDPFADFGAEADAYETAEWTRKRWMPLWMWGVLAVGTVVVAGVVLWWVFSGPEFEPPRAPEEPPLSEVIPTTPPEPLVPEEPDGPDGPEELSPDEPEEPSPDAPEEGPPDEPEEVPPDEPDAPPEPEVPEPRPPRVDPPPVAPSTTTLVDRGWAAVDRGDLGGAVGYFGQALERAPADADAHFGYGYVLLQQGNAAEARTHLCRALSGASDPGLANEARGILDGAGLSCP